MKHKMTVLLPTSVQQGDNSVLNLLGALAAGLQEAAVEKMTQGATPDMASVQEKKLAAKAIRDCMDRIRRECGDLWREFHANRKSQKE